MRAFMIKFPAALGPLLAETLRNTISQMDQEPETTEQENLFGYIFDHLVGCMTDDSSADLLAMSKVCGRNGPRTAQWPSFGSNARTIHLPRHQLSSP